MPLQNLFLSTFEYKTVGLYLQDFVLVSLMVHILLYLLTSLSTPAPTLCFLEHSFTHPLEQQLWSSACLSPVWSLGHSIGCSYPSLDCISSDLLPIAVFFLTASLGPGGAELQIPPLPFQAYGRKCLATFTWLSSALQAKKEERGREREENRQKKFYIFLLRKGNRR